MPPAHRSGWWKSTYSLTIRSHHRYPLYIVKLSFYVESNGFLHNKTSKASRQ